MALVREPHAFLLVAALAGVVWTVWLLSSGWLLNAQCLYGQEAA